jgi:hypothetical protein
MNVRAVISRKRDVPPVRLHQPANHWLGSMPDRLRRDERTRLSFRGKQIGEKVQQIPQGGLRRSSMRLILFELREGEASGTRSFPGLFSRAQESFNEDGRQAARRSGLL